jgi:hypothetical protein
MFFYIETFPRDPDRQQSIKIAVEGKIHILVHKSLSSQLTQDQCWAKLLLKVTIISER